MLIAGDDSSTSSQLGIHEHLIGNMSLITKTDALLRSVLHLFSPADVQQALQPQQQQGRLTGDLVPAAAAGAAEAYQLDIDSYENDQSSLQPCLTALSAASSKAAADKAGVMANAAKAAAEVKLPRPRVGLSTGRHQGTSGGAGSSMAAARHQAARNATGSNGITPEVLEVVQQLLDENNGRVVEPKQPAEDNAPAAAEVLNGRPPLTSPEAYRDHFLPRQLKEAVASIAASRQERIDSGSVEFGSTACIISHISPSDNRRVNVEVCVCPAQQPAVVTAAAAAARVQKLSNLNCPSSSHAATLCC